MKSLVYIIGAGGNANIVTEIIEKKFKIGGFISNKKSDYGKSKKLFLENEFLKKYKKKKIIIAVGENKNRLKIFKKFKKYGHNFPNVIHKTAFISKSANIGIGNIIMPNVIINSNARIGNFNLINTSSIIEHDCHVDSFVSISPKSIVCGNCKLNEGVFLGANTCVIHNIEIGEWSVVGSCSNVIKDIKKNTLNFGNPSKTIKKINKNYQVL